MKFDISVIFFSFEKSLDKIQASLKSDKNKGYFTRRPEFLEKMKTHFKFSNFVPENRAVCEILWKKKSMVRADRPQMTI